MLQALSYKRFLLLCRAQTALKEKPGAAIETPEHQAETVFVAMHNEPF
ncbi:MAG: hypothetical protein RQ736_08435 [Thiogranum sp.]|nr:hypothetical protein [Thiogranum sp.]